MNNVTFFFRQCRRSPLYAIVTVFILALGIGATTAIYSAIDAVILNPTDEGTEGLLQIAEKIYHHEDQSEQFIGVSPPVFVSLTKLEDSFSEFGWCDTTMLYHPTADFAERTQTALVSPNFFKLWNASPILGRTFDDSDATTLNRYNQPTAGTAVMLSFKAWQKYFQGEDDVIGTTIELSEHHYTVVGVMPSHFQFPYGNTQFWIPTVELQFDPKSGTGPNTTFFCRLKPQVTVPQLESRLEALAHHITDEYADNFFYPQDWSRRPQGLGFWVRPIRSYFESSYRSDELRKTLLGLSGAIAFVLLIVCANLANLTLVRTERRQQELAVRGALGAGRGQLIRQLMTENFLLALTGGVAGLLVAYWGTQLLTQLIPEYMPRTRAIALNPQVLGITLLVTMTTSLLFGLIPAIQGTRPRLNETLKQTGQNTTGGLRRNRFVAGLVITEVALALVLLTGAGLMIRSVTQLLNVDPGYNPDKLLQVTVNLPWDRYAYPHREARNQILEQIHQRLTTIPGIQFVGLDKINYENAFLISDSQNEIKAVTAGCGIDTANPFDALGVPLIQGRLLGRQDLEDDYFNQLTQKDGRSAVVINQALAALAWPGENALGKTLRVPKGKRLYEVVGIVGNIRTGGFQYPVQPVLYRPFHEFDLAGVAPAFMVRTEGDPRNLIPSIRTELKAAEPGMSTPTIAILTEKLYNSTQAHRTYMNYLVTFAIVGLILAALGIYGVLAYSVAQRTREIGIRMAIGADRPSVVRMVMKQGLFLVMIGTAIGLTAAVWLSRYLESQLFQIEPTDPITFTLGALLLITVGSIACFVPARKASTVVPMTALRSE